MKTEPITCVGSELISVLAAIRDRGGVVTSDPFPHQGETPANPAAPEAVKGAVAPRDQLNDPKIPCYGSAVSTGLCPDSAETVGDGLSIETRMSALQAKLAASGKIKRRQPREARMPYSDHD